MQNLISAALGVVLSVSAASAATHEERVLVFITPHGFTRETHKVWMQEDQRTFIGSGGITVKLFTDGGSGDVFIHDRAQGSFINEDLGQTGWRLLPSSDWAYRQLRRRLNVIGGCALALLLTLAYVKWKSQSRETLAEMARGIELRPQSIRLRSTPALRPAA